MNLFDNSIINAYAKQAEINILTEGVDAIYGSDDVLLDQLISEAIDAKEIENETFGPIYEELTPNEKYQANQWGSSGGSSFYREAFISQHPEAQKAFAAHRYTEGMGRIRIPLGSLDDDSAKPHSDVVGHLKQHGYDIDHETYRSGLASKKIAVGNPEKGIPIQEKTVHKRIGAILQEIGAPDHIKRAFEKDPFRSGAKTNEYDMILSHNPEDVYGMSTGRGWTSCSQMRRGESGYGGPASKHMREEISNHTHVAYLVPKGGNVDTEAIARTSFKKHHSIDGSHDTLIGDGTVYGTAPRGFASAAKREVEKLFPIRQNLVYQKNTQVYNDNGKSFHFGSEPSPEIMDKAWSKTKNNDEASRGEILRFVKPGQKFKSTKMTQVSKILKNTEDAVTKNDFHSAVDHLSSLHEHLTDREINHMSWKLGHESDSHVEVLKNKVADLFDPNNSSHIDKMSRYGKNRFYYSGKIYGDIMSKSYARHANKPIKNVDDVLRHVRLTTAGGSSSPHETKMNFADNHQFGGNLLHKIGRVLGENGMLNKHTFSQAYFGVDKNKGRRGNLYDHVVKLTTDDVPGSHQLLDDTVAELKHRMTQRGGGFFSGTNGELEVARAFRYSKPDTRKVLASKMGIDHVPLMRKYKKEFDAQDARLAELVKKAQESEQATG